MSHYFTSLIPVVIASTLKPVKDIRAYQKLALSLGETSKYQLNIIGFSEEKLTKETGISFYSGIRKYHSRISRIFVQLKFAFHLLKIKPKLVICCTYELLPIASLFKILLNYKLVYDVQENYRCNLELNPNLSSLKKKLAEWVIQIAENSAKIDLFILAESCYQWEMQEKKPFLILGNKHKGKIESNSNIKFGNIQLITFCITGTLSPFYGTLEGIRWFKLLIKKFPEYRLQIIGHCPLPTYLEEIKEEVKGLSQIQLDVSENPISHEQILQTLRSSNFALLPYQNHPCLNSKMPTKLFECAALGIPVLISPNPLWEEFIRTYMGGFSIDFTHNDQVISTFYEALNRIYFSSTVPDTVLWEDEKTRFQKAIENLLTK